MFANEIPLLEVMLFVIVIIVLLRRHMRNTYPISKFISSVFSIQNCVRVFQFFNFCRFSCDVVVD